MLQRWLGKSRTIGLSRLAGMCMLAWLCLAGVNVSAQVANDNFTNATLIAGIAGTTTGPGGGNVTATKEPGEPTHAGNSGGASVWFRWVAPNSSRVTFTTAGSSFDTVLAVYTGQAVNALSVVANNDDTATSVQAAVTFSAVAGKIYWIAIDGSGGATGNYQLSWSSAGYAGEFQFTSATFEASELENFSPTYVVMNPSLLGGRVTVTRTGGTVGRVIVQYQVRNLTALVGTHYTINDAVTQTLVPGGFNGTLVFDDFQTSASFLINMINDGVATLGSRERFVTLTITSVTLAPGESSQIIAPTITANGLQNSTMVIYDDDFGVHFERMRYRVLESAGTAHLRLLRGQGVPDGSTTRWRVNSLFRLPAPTDNLFSLDSGSDYATPNVDFTPIAGSVGWATGQAFVDLDIDIANDAVVEFNEDFVIELFNASGDTPAPRCDPSYTYVTIVTKTSVAGEQPAGSVDPTYNRDFFNGSNPPFLANPGANDIVHAVAIQANNQSVIGGDFTSVNGQTRNHLARINIDGTPDANFGGGVRANAYVDAIVVLSDQRILIGGGFTSYNATGRNSIAMLLNNGNLDGSFNPGSGANDAVRALAVYGNATGNSGKILAAGNFTQFNGNPQNRVVRLTQSGAVDSSFVIGTGANGPIYAVAIQTDDKVIIGGDFTSFAGVPRNRIARLNADGSLDVTFDPGTGANATVYALSLQTDGRILAGGAFSLINLREAGRIARLNTDGSMDENFDVGTGADDTVYSIVLQADGNILMGGLFTLVNSTRRVGMARLLTSGYVDTTFMDTAYNHFAGLPTRFSQYAEAKNYVRSMALQSDNNLIIGGSFKRIGGGERNTQAFGSASPWWTPFNTPTNTPIWIGRDDIRNRFNYARVVGGQTPGAGNIGFTQAEYRIDEGAGFIYVTMSRDNGNLAEASVNFTTAERPFGSGASTSGVDYQPVNFEVTWITTYPTLGTVRASAQSGANNTTTSGTDDIFITVLDDALLEGDESADLIVDLPASNLQLGGLGLTFPTEGEVIPIGVALGRSRSVLTIADDDVEPTFIGFSTNSFIVNENALSATITVTRTGGTTRSVSTDYSVTPGTALDGQDFTAVFGRLTFAPGETIKTFTVPIIDDALAELDETVNLQLLNISPGVSYRTGEDVATLTIFDNDYGTGQLRFEFSSYSVNEAAGTLTVQVFRTGGNVGAIAVDYNTPDGSAFGGSDFTAVSGTLNWNHLDTAPKSIVIPIKTDGLVEGPETFSVQLFNARRVSDSVAVPVAGVNPVTVTITDADSYGSFQFVSANFAVAENGGHATITVVRVNGSSGTASVNYRTLAGTAVPGTDYSDVTGTLVFAPGVTSTNFIVPVIDNPAQGPLSKTVVVELDPLSLVNATLGSPSTAILDIVDDETLSQPPGGVEPGYNVDNGPNNFIQSLALQPDGRLLIGGDFTTFNNFARKRIARLNTDGSLDSTFNPGAGANGSVRSVAVQPDGRVIVGGFFTTLNNTNRSRIARVNQNGALDLTFDPGSGADNPVYSVAVHLDSASYGRVVIGGSFASVNGIARSGVARLGTNGTVDASFNPGTGANGPVYAVAVQPDGRILVGGDFTTFNDVPNLNGIVRLKSDGSIDTTFTNTLSAVNGTDGAVRAITLQTDGRILIGGSFTSVNGTGLNYLARLNTDGTLDGTFNPGVGGDRPVAAVTTQSDGKILVAGEFAFFGGVTRNSLTRLNYDGSTDVDIDFGSGANNFIAAVVQQVSDGRILVAGGFTSFNGEARNYLARLFGGDVESAGKVEFTSPTFTISENAQTATIGVRRTGGSVGTVTVDVAVSDLTATGGASAVAGVDYLFPSPNPLTITFGPGETFQTFNLTIVDDSLPEATETISLQLGNVTGPAGAGLGNQPTAILSIIDDDAVVGFSSPSYSVTENNSAVISVSRQGGTNATTIVQYSVGSGTALAGVDFVATNGSLTFQPGDTVKSFTVTIINDTTPEPNETVLLTLSNPTGNAQVGLSNAVLTIVDNDQSPGQLGFISAVFNVNEAVSNAVITVTRLNGSAGFVTVNFSATAPGGPNSATAGLDFIPTNGVLSFADGETNKTFSVPIILDSIPEGDEFLNLTLSNPTGGATLGQGTARLVIANNDILLFGNVRFTGATYITNESAPFALISLERYGSTNNIYAGEMDVTFFTGTNGTAKAGVNYLPTTNIAVWPAGVGGVTNVVVPVLHELLIIGDRTVSLHLTNVTVTTNGVTQAGTLGTPATALLTIQEVDTSAGVLGFSVANYTVAENGLNATITVTRTNGYTGVVTVKMATSNGTAVNGTDYSGFTNVITFGDGVVTTNISIPIIDNALQEGSRTVNLTLSEPTDGATLGLANATLNILDDELPAGSGDPSLITGTGANDTIYALAYQASSSKIYIGGQFTNFNGTPVTNVARLNGDGSLDLTFSPASITCFGTNGTVRSVGVYLNGSDIGKVIIAGQFDTINGVLRTNIARLNTDGSVDATFNAALGTDDIIYSALIQVDGRVVIGGAFTVVNGVSRNFVARLNSDGTLDAAFDPGAGADNIVRALAFGDNGNIYIGGDFTIVNGVLRSGVARLDASGGVDKTFDPGTGTDSYVAALAVQNDGELLIGGAFASVNGVNRGRLARLFQDGSVDTSFATGAGANDFIDAISIQQDGKPIIAGSFTTYDGFSFNRIARLEPDGTLDLSFNCGTGANDFITSLAIQTDNAIVAAGEFTVFDGAPHLRIVRLVGGENIGSGSFNFLNAAFTVNEYDGAANVVITRTGGLSNTVSVVFQTFDGTALNGRDYTSVSNFLTFVPGQVRTNIFVPVIANTLVDGDRIANLVLSSPSGAALGAQPTATLTILDDDSVVGFNSAAFSVNENAGTALITVARAGGTTLPVSVNYATADGSGLNGTHYLSASGTLTLAAGQSSATFSVPIIDNIALDGNHTVLLGLSNLVGSAILGQSNAVLTIFDNEFAPGVVSFASTNYVVSEGGGNAVITLMRTNGSSGAISVHYKSYNGTALSGLDYVAVDDFVAFLDGETTKSFNVPIIDDFVQDDGETVFLALLSASGGATLGVTNALLTINDNDVLLGYSTNAYRFSETSGVATINVVRSGLLNQSFDVNFDAITRVTDTAFDGVNYIRTNGTLTFGPGVTNLTFDVAIINNTLIETDKTFTLTLGSPVGASLLGYTNAVVTIVEDDLNTDLAVIKVATPDPIYTNDTYTYTVTVTNRGPSTATGVSLVDMLPPQLTFVSATASQGSFVPPIGNLITFDFGTITNNGSAVAFVTVTAPPTPTYVTNIAIAAMVEPDATSTNNAVTNITRIRQAMAFFVTDGAQLISESFAPGNGAIENGETVGMKLALKNIGNRFATNLVATLLVTNGVLSPSGAQTYGPFSLGQSKGTNFTFTASGLPGSAIGATLQLAESTGFAYDPVTYTFVLGTTVTASNTSAIVINDPTNSTPGAATPYPSTITISGVTGLVSKVTMTISNLTHSFPDDIDMLLVSPSGQKVLVMSDAGGGNGVTNVSFTLDDGAATYLPDSARIFPGTYRPADYQTGDTFPAPAPVAPYFTNLSAFNGSNPNGVWSLYVVDDSAGDVGSVSNGWSLTITAVVPIAPTAALSITMTDSPDPVLVSSNLTYVLVATNNGPDTATSVRITNTLPAGVVFASATNSAGTFSVVGSQVIFDVGTLTNGGGATFAINATPWVPGNITNVATISSAQADSFTGDNTASAATRVNPLADISVVVFDSPDPVSLLSNLVYTIAVTNRGPSTATNVLFTNNLPSGVTLLSISSVPGVPLVTNVTGKITGLLGNLASNGVVTITVTTRTTAEGILTNVATVSSQVTDPNPSNNVAVAITSTVNASADLVVSMTNAPNPVIQNSNLVFTMTVTNRGPSTATSVTLTNPLPSGLVFNSGTSTVGTVTNFAGVVITSIGTLPVGTNVVVTINTTPTLLGTVTTAAGVSSATPDPVLTNNIAIVSTFVRSGSIDVVAAGATLVSEGNLPANGAIDPGETVTVALALRNKGDASTTNLVATLQGTGGVTAQSGPQTYGAIAPASTTIMNYSFTAVGNLGDTVTATLALSDNGVDLGTAVFQFQLGAATHFTNAAGTIVTPTIGIGAPYPSTLDVSGLAGTIIKVKVTLNNFSHQYPDDYDILLVSPSGRSVLIMSDAGGAIGVNNLTLTFDDAAAAPLPDEPLVAITNGTYKPSVYVGNEENLEGFPAPAPAGPYATALSNFAGSNPNGTWSLYVVDDQNFQSGSIGSWSLDIVSVSTVNPAVDLVASVVDSPDPVPGGSNLVYTVTIVNNGPNTATNVVVTNFLPSASLNLITAQANQGSVDTSQPGLVISTLPTLPVGTNLTLTIVMQPTNNVATTVTNIVIAGASQTELNAANNIAITDTTLEGVVLKPTSTSLTAGSFNMTISGRTGLTYVIQASDDLNTWTPIYTNAPVNGVLNFVDSDASKHRQRFYRAVVK